MAIASPRRCCYEGLMGKMKPEKYYRRTPNALHHPQVVAGKAEPHSGHDRPGPQSSSPRTVSTTPGLIQTPLRFTLGVGYTPK